MLIPRFVNLNPSRTEIHGFCDFLTQTYSAAVYLKKVDTTVKVSLVEEKTKNINRNKNYSSTNA